MKGRPKLHPELIYKRGKRSCYLLQYHLVLTTDQNYPVIKDNIETRLHEIIKFLIEKFGCTLIEIRTKEDHVHIFFEAMPQIDLSVLVNNIKTVTSRLLKKEFANELKQFNTRFWSNTYFIGTISEATNTAVQQYIQMQKEK